MKANETNIFVFIAALALGLLVSMNINFNRQPSRTVLSAHQYKDAYAERQKLYKDINNTRDSYNNNSSKLEKYRGSDSSSSKILKEVTKELDDYKLLLGTSEVTGEGIKITLQDGEFLSGNSDEIRLLNWERTIHDRDLRLTINNLRNAGAKAISINGIRIIGTSSFICANEFILIDGIKLAPPYYINAIGNRGVLENYMYGNESYLKFNQRFREIKVSVEPVAQMKIPAYIGNIQYRFMTDVQG